MKKIFYSLIGLALLTGCSNDDMMPDAPAKELVRLESVGAGSITRGAIDRTWWDFSFTAGDQVLVAGITLEDYEASRDDKAIRNTFTFDGAYWTQDEPTGNYQGIYVQDDMMIAEIRSYGGFAVNKSYNDQSTEERYVAADELKASIMAYPYIGEIKTSDDKQYTATLEHMNADFVLKVYDGTEEADILGENAVLEVIVDKDGTYSGADTEIYKAWNTGKSMDDKGTFSTFRVMLPDGCSIDYAQLSSINSTTTEVKRITLTWAVSGNASRDQNLERGLRYTTTYTYTSNVTRAIESDALAVIENGMAY